MDGSRCMPDSVAVCAYPIAVASIANSPTIVKQDFAITVL